MLANATKFIEFMRKSVQFIIPIYQRTYSWTRPQCEQLWKDIIRAADPSVSAHFIGSVVYVEKGLYSHSSIPQLLVIDGQQRLTTLSILLCALGRGIQQRGSEGEINQKKINNYFLFNSEEDGDLHYKLLLTQSDKTTLFNLLDNRELPENASKKVVENFELFEERIKKTEDLITVYQGLSKLIVVDISLNRDHDNPQLIFESLNSTGLELSQADLIRNYILMGLEPKEQEALYNEYWYPMEQSLGPTDYAALFDRFMRDYLTAKTGRIPNIREVYDVFKGYSQEHKGSVREIVADIYKYAKYFMNMVLDKEPDKELGRIFKDINELKVDVAYPFLMELYDDYSTQVLSREEFVKIAKLVESYVMRRSICGIPTNSMNKTFATLSKEIDKANYLESIQAAFMWKDSYRRFPNNDEFEKEFLIKDIYYARIRNYLLRKLENHDRKEHVNVEDYTIEHIMPQNEKLSPEWQKMLGPSWKQIHTEKLHTIGNLTLTGYNSELSDSPFIEKRDMKGGFADSPLRLNRGLAKLEKWDKDEIEIRAKNLIDIAMTIWIAPALSMEVLMKYNKPTTEEVDTYTIDTIEGHGYLQGNMRELFEHLRKRILNIDASVKEEFKKLYIAYKTSTNFVDIVPQKSRLRLSLNMKFNEINDPKGICKDVTGLGRWGNGDVEVGIQSFEELDYVMSLIHQSFEKQADNNGQLL